MEENKVSYVIEREIAVLSKNSNDYTKELNIVSWNNNKAKYDIRNWSPNKEKSLKGISLTEEETIALYQALKNEFEK